MKVHCSKYCIPFIDFRFKCGVHTV